VPVALRRQLRARGIFRDFDSGLPGPMANPAVY